MRRGLGLVMALGGGLALATLLGLMATEAVEIDPVWGFVATVVAAAGLALRQPPVVDLLGPPGPDYTPLRNDGGGSPGGEADGAAAGDAGGDGGAV